MQKVLTRPEAGTSDVSTIRELQDPVAPAVSKGRSRLNSIDLLRGLVMVIMMLDHTRDFAHNYSLFNDPTDVEHTTAALFLTRWITHFCAPVFVFLAGTGSYLQLARGKSRAELAKFLLTRGMWLVVLEFTLVRAGFMFNFHYSFLGAAQVIWVIGVSMIILAGLIYLPTKWVAAFGILLICGHNLLDGIQVQPWQGPGSPAPAVWADLWMILHQPGPIPLFGVTVVYVLYPLVPWVGVMAAGYAFGAVYQMEPVARRQFLMRIGIAAISCFVILRAINIYGDPFAWHIQRSRLFTVLSFLNTTKYPPSLLFLLMTLGPAITFLAMFEKTGSSALGNALITLGRVPLFFYLLQWPTAHVLPLLLGKLVHKPTSYLFRGPLTAADPGAGFDLWVVYVLWGFGVILLFPLCAWYASVKKRRSDWWLSYL